MNAPADYKAIVLWGRYLGSIEDFIKAEQERASADQAPLDAIYRIPRYGKDGKLIWRRMTDLDPDNPVRLEWEGLK